MRIRTQQLASPSLWDSLRRRAPKRNAMVEIRNLVAGAADLRQISEETVAEIAGRYGPNVGSAFRSERAAIFADFVESCLADHHLDGTEIEEIQHLRRLLGMPVNEAAGIRDRIIEQIYRESLDVAIADGELSGDERDALANLKEGLGLSEAQADGLYEAVAKARVQAAYTEAMADERLSPQEEEQLAAIARSLEVSVTLDGAARSQLDRYRLLWLLENGEVPPLAVDIKLQKSEVCYAQRAVGWHETRRVTTGISYAGPQARIKIAKGVYWRMGHIKGKRHSTDKLVQIDSGNIYLTNKRLIFMGAKGNKNIRLAKVLSFDPYGNGITVQKDTGKSPFLAFDHEVELFAATLHRAWSDA